MKQGVTDVASDRIIRRLAMSLGIGGVIMGLVDIPEIVEQGRDAPVWWTPLAAALAFGFFPVLALVSIRLSRTVIRVVASAIGGPTDIITDACGRLVPPGDATALSATLRTLVDDGSLRRLLGRAAPRRAQQLCDPPTQIRRLYEALASPMRSVVSA